MIAPVSETSLAASIFFAEESLRPAHPQKIVAALARLRSLTVSRSGSEADLKLLAAAYAEELRRYPEADVMEAIREWPRWNKFWPSLAELIDPLERNAAPRRALLEALARGYRKPETSRDWIEPTEADLAAVAELMAKHGLVRDEKTGKFRRIEDEPLTKAQRKQAADELAAYRLLPEDDPRVQAMLEEMRAA